LTSGDNQNDARPAPTDAGGQSERPAGRRPPPAAPVMTSGDNQNDARPAPTDAGGQSERPAGRRPPPAAPVIALRMEGLLTWTAERPCSGRHVG